MIFIPFHLFFCTGAIANDICKNEYEKYIAWFKKTAPDSNYKLKSYEDFKRFSLDWLSDIEELNEARELYKLREQAYQRLTPTSNYRLLVTNEYLESKNIFCIIDGHGGSEKVASVKTPKENKESIAQQGTKNKQEQSVKSKFEPTNEEFERKLIEMDEKRVEEDGGRKHNKEAVANHCLMPQFSGLYGDFINKCAFEVRYDYCLVGPKPGSWGVGVLECDNFAGKKPTVGGQRIGPKRTQAQHTKNAEMVLWVACKSPYTPYDIIYNSSSKSLNFRCR